MRIWRSRAGRTLTTLLAALGLALLAGCGGSSKAVTEAGRTVTETHAARGTENHSAPTSTSKRAQHYRRVKRQARRSGTSPQPRPKLSAAAARQLERAKKHGFRPPPPGEHPILDCLKKHGTLNRKRSARPPAAIRRRREALRACVRQRTD